MRTPGGIWKRYRSPGLPAQPSSSSSTERATACSAIFDGPTRAIRCATAIEDAGRELGFHVRAGVHTGEVERVDGGAVRGTAVHLAARVAALAGKGEVFVSSTVKDLAAGSPLESEESASGTSWNVGDPLYLGRRTLA